MPSWKKVITSGSNAVLHNITSSGDFEISGNISGSATSTGSFGHGYIDNKLGINTTTPQSALEVFKTDNFAPISFHDGYYGYSFGGGYLPSDVNPNSNGMSLYMSSTKLHNQLTHGSGQWVWLNGGGNRMTLDNNGNLELPTGNISGSVTSTGSFGSVHTVGHIGIGTKTPDQDIHILANNASIRWEESGGSIGRLMSQGASSGTSLFTQGSTPLHLATNTQGPSADWSVRLAGGSKDVEFAGDVSGSSTSTGSFGALASTNVLGDLTLKDGGYAYFDNYRGPRTHGEYLYLTSTRGVQFVDHGAGTTFHVDGAHQKIYNGSPAIGMTTYFYGDLRLDQGNYDITGSSTSTASFGRLQATTIGGNSPLTIESPTLSGDTDIDGNLTVTGDITAQNYIVSSSVTYMTQSFSSGSTIFGDDVDDTHQFTGSVFIKGMGGGNGKTLVLGSYGDSATQTIMRSNGASNPNILIERGSSGNNFQLFHDGNFSIRRDTNKLISVLVGGNVGIGVDTPATQLDVDGTSRFQVDTSGTYSVLKLLDNGDAARGHITIGAQTIALYPQSSKTKGIVITRASSNTNSNRVGVGFDSSTTDLPSKLTISGSVEESLLKVYNHQNTSVFEITGSKISGSSTSTGSFGAGYIDNKLGIGTTAPEKTLHVLDSAEITARISSTNSIGAQLGIDADGTGGGEWRLISGANGASIGGGAFGIFNNAYRFNITSAGNVGIGETSPSEKLSMEGNIFLTDTSPAIYFKDKGVGDSFEIKRDGDTSKLTAYSSGVKSSEIHLQARAAGDGASRGGILFRTATHQHAVNGPQDAVYINLSGSVELMRDGANLSGSSTSTGSFGKLLGDGSQLTGISTGGLGNIVEDTTPQLGGDLDLNSNDITGTGNISITGGLTLAGGSPNINGSGGNVYMIPTNFIVRSNITNDSGDVKVGDNLTVTGNVSGSSTSTGSFGHGYIDSKLGVGTTSPSEMLHVSEGEIKIEHSTTGRMVIQGGTRADVIMTDTGGGGNTKKIQMVQESDAFKIRSLTDAGDAGTERMHFDLTNNRIGIGTTSPGQTFHVVGGGLFTGTLYIGTTLQSYNGDLYLKSNNSETEIFLDNDDIITFKTSNIERLRITDTLISGSATSTGSFGDGRIAGKLGIQTTTPRGPIDVMGSLGSQGFYLSDSGGAVKLPTEVGHSSGS